MTTITNILILLAILGFAFIAVAAEFALLQSRLSFLDDKTTFIAKMVRNKSEFLSTIQIGITISSLLAGYFGEPAMTSLLSFIPLGGKPLGILSFILVTYLSIVLSELVPKNVAMVFPQSTLKMVAIPIRIIHTVFFPMVWVLDKSSNLLTKIMGIPSMNEGADTFTQEELVRLAHSSAKGSSSNLTHEDALFLERAVKLDETKIEDIMTAREHLSTDSRIYSHIFANDLSSYQYRGHSIPLEKVLATATVHETLILMARMEVPVLAVELSDKLIGIITDSDCYKQMFPELVSAVNKTKSK